MKKLDHRIRNLKIAEQAVIEELQLLFPMGQMVRANIQHGQINPSRGEVIGHPGGVHAYVLVRLDSRTKEVRHVAAENIIR